MQNLVKSTVTANHRSGFSIGLATVAGGILAVTMAALSMYSGQEMESVKKVLLTKKTEYNAFSGLQWAYAKLFQGRWYQPEGNQFTNPGKPWKNCASETPDILKDSTPGAISTVFLDEVAADHFAPPPPKKTGKISLLDHINVLAYSKVGDEESLIYGKFIMCPEPLLNSNSTTGYETDTALESGTETIETPVPAVLVNKGEEGFANMAQMTVKEVLKKTGDTVKKGDGIMVFGSICSDAARTPATQRYYLKAAYDGVLEKVNFTSADIGKDVPIGAPAISLKRAPGMRNADITLKKMLRITRIPNSVFKASRLGELKHRYEIYQWVSAQTEEYVKNYSVAKDVSPGIENAFVAVKDKTVLSESDVIKQLTQGGSKSPDEYEVAGKGFMKDLLSGFYPPYNTIPQKVRDRFAASATFVLGVQPCDIAPDTKELLGILGPHFGKDYLEMLKTKPKMDPRLYKIESTKAYMEAQDPKGQFANSPGKELNSLGYRDTVAILPEAAKSISVYLTQGTPWKPDYFEQLVREGRERREDYFFLPHKNGWYKWPLPGDITLKSIPVHYWYENPEVKDPDTGTPFRMRVDYMMDFFRKHYDDGQAKTPADELRAEDEVRDEPQAPGPPDVTGARYAGLSS